jgi:purine-binding chemotaxis protein CheW
MEQADPQLPQAHSEGAAQAALPPTLALTRGFADAMPLAAQSNGASNAVRQHERQGIRIGELRLMVRYEDGSELTEMPGLHRLPNTPAWFRGVANLHGLLTPVFDLCAYFGVAPQATARPMLLVLLRGADAAGVVIDGLPERLRWTDDALADIATAPPGLAGTVTQAVLLGGELHFDLDCAALLNRLEGDLASASA